jgi:UDP-N-acetylglucosamine 2-epimerase (non-hydrolysing)
MNLKQIKVVSVVGARPNYMKMAPVAWELAKLNDVEHRILHSGQHFSAGMGLDSFLKDLKIEISDQIFTSEENNTILRWQEMLSSIKAKLAQLKPDWVFVYGDVDTTLLAALAAKSLGIKVAHIESGLRSFDATMPEERNRFAVDHLADLLFVTEQSGLDNLKKEGLLFEKVYFVGNTMIDTLYALRDQIQKQSVKDQPETPYALVTFHRPSNVDTLAGLENIAAVLSKLGDIEVVWPMHPRVKASLEYFDLLDKWQNLFRLKTLKPADYLSFQKLLSDSAFVITDSGGVQEECCFWKKQCYTIRPSTERPSTIIAGWNELVKSSDLSTFVPSYDANLLSQQPEKWDGKAAKRLVENWKRVAFNDKHVS